MAPTDDPPPPLPQPRHPCRQDPRQSDIPLADPDALVFTGERGGALSKNFVRRDFRAAADALGMGDVTLHDLRHFGGTHTAISGATLRELQARLGHASPAAAMRYQHAAERRDKAVADRWAASYIDHQPASEGNVRRIRGA